MDGWREGQKKRKITKEVVILTDLQKLRKVRDNVSLS